MTAVQYEFYDTYSFNEVIERGLDGWQIAGVYTIPDFDDRTTETRYVMQRVKAPEDEQTRHEATYYADDEVHL